MENFFPLFHRFEGRKCLVAGHGVAADNKAERLRRSGASVQRCARYDDSRLLEGQALVVGACASEEENVRLSEDAKQRNIPVVIIDRLELCTAIFPAVVERDSVVIAISTGGHAPSLAQHLKGLISRTVPAAYGRLSRLIASWRARVAKQLPAVGQRRVFWEDMLDGSFADLALAGRETEAGDFLAKTLSASGSPSPSKGQAWLVGAGPGDPDLLTLKALKMLHRADVIFYDRLVAPEIVAMARAEAERVYIGKRRCEQAMSQSEINRALIAAASEGKRVLRLKGGDPLIFARGGEELASLISAGITVTVVPGVTAATACAAIAGIPLTHRDYVSSVRFLTGHSDTSCMPWSELCSRRETLVFYMGVRRLDEICRQLIEHGREASTPAALVARCGLSGEQLISGSLATLPKQAKAARIEPPTIIIIGEVVALGGVANSPGEEMP